MKVNKRIPALLGVATALSLAILPLGAWTTAKAEEPSEPVTMSADYGVQPLFGGDDGQHFDFAGGRVNVNVWAENWIWPNADKAIVNITSNAYNTYYGFKVEFVWTNQANRSTVWYEPAQFNTENQAPMQLLPLDKKEYKISKTKACNAKGLSGKPGSQQWACDHIYVSVWVRIGNEPIQSYMFDPIYF